MLLSSYIKSLIVYLYYLKKVFYSNESIIQKPCELENINFQLINNDSNNQLYQNFPLFIAKPQYSFNHGVLSGDSSSHSTIIWTRITPRNKIAKSSLIPVFFIISNDESFNEIIISGVTYTNSLIDFTIKLHIKNLSPDSTYYYKFFNNERSEISSNVGISKTLPTTINNDLLLEITDSIKVRNQTSDFLLQLNNYQNKFFTRLKDYRYRYSKEFRSTNETILFGTNPEMYQKDIFILNDYTQALLEWFPIRPPKRHLYGKNFNFGDVLKINIFDNFQSKNYIFDNTTDLIYSKRDNILQLYKNNESHILRDLPVSLKITSNDCILI